MKKKLVQTRIILSCIIVCGILIFSCQKSHEDLNLEQKQEKEVKRISIDEMKIKIGNSKDFENLSKLFDFKFFNNSYSTKNDNSIYLDTNEIVMIEKGETTTYTFLIRGYSGENFQNLVVDFDKNGKITSSSIIEYKPSTTWLSNKSLPFSGTAKVTKNESFDSNQIKQLLGLNRSNWCVIGASGQWECNFGNNHYPNQPYTNCTSWDYVITYNWGFCEQSITSNTIEVGGAGTESEEVEGGGGSPTAPVIPEEEENCEITFSDLQKVFTKITENNAKKLAGILNSKSKDFGINNKYKLLHFLAQAGHEVFGFSKGISVSETTKYSTEERLLQIFGKYYSKTDTISRRKPKDYVNKPEKHANYVYCCRNGNGDEASGDGYKYRGRGIFQLTGKSNYKSFKSWYNDKYDPDKDFVSKPDLLVNNDTVAVLSALWFYKKRVLDKIKVDSTTSVLKVTKKINGGINGLTERKLNFQRLKDSISCKK